MWSLGVGALQGGAKVCVGLRHRLLGVVSRSLVSRSLKESGMVYTGFRARVLGCALDPKQGVFRF